MNPLARLVIRLTAVALVPLLVDCGADSNASPPITASVAPTTSTMSAGGTQALTATLRNDSSRQEVTWMIAPASGAGTQVTDAARADPLAANGSRRELMLRFWYPAAVDQAGCGRAPYTSPEVWSYFSELAEVPLPTVRTHSCLDAPVAHGAYPVVVFSHGLTGTFTDHTFLFEDLASHGYIVVSVDHTYEATAVAFADGRMARSLYGSHLTRIVRPDEAALSLAESVRVDDVRFVVDELQRLTARPDSPFAAHLDLAAIATAGHSWAVSPHSRRSGRISINLDS